MTRRTETFIGSAMWRKRDVSVQSLASVRDIKGGPKLITVCKDIPSHITIIDYVNTPIDTQLTTLAHRVRMLDT